MIDAVLQDRAALTRSQAFAVHDTDTEEPLSCAILDEVGESRFCLADRHAVQVNFGLNAEATTGQFSDRPAADCLTVIAHAFRIAAFHRVDVGLHALTQGVFLIRPRELRLGLRPFRRPFDAVAGTQRFCSGYRPAEEVCVVVTQGGVLRLWCSVNIKYSEPVACGQTFEHLPH